MTFGPTYNCGIYGWILVTGQGDRVQIAVRRKMNQWTTRPVDLVDAAKKAGALRPWDTLRQVERQWDGNTLSDIYVCEVDRHEPDLVAWLEAVA